MCTTLAATEVAGHPGEWPEDLLRDSTNDTTTIRDELWATQTTPNGVLGVKFCYNEPTIESFFRAFGRTADDDAVGTHEAWESVFPNCRHVVMTRRNKFRLAVSWWKSINGAPGHLSHDGSPLPWRDSVPTTPAELADCYDFEAIKALVLESVEREAGIQDLLSELQVSPFTVTYEDFVADYDGTVREVLTFLGLIGSVSEIPPPLVARTSDGVNEEWLDRFASDLKKR